MDEVEAVTAVLWRHLEPTPYEAPGVEAGKILMRGVAQEAIAALDACRRENIADWYTLGRTAGLREAAAVVASGYNYDAANAILALIDAGSPPPLRNASREEAAGWPSLKQIIDAGSPTPPGSD